MKSVLQPRAAMHQAAVVGLAPHPGDEGAQQRLLCQAHARVRRHLEGAQLQQAAPAGGAVGRVELVDAELGAVGIAGHVDQQVAEDPVDQPGRRGRGGGERLEGDLEFVSRVVARLIDARMLAGRTDEQAGKEIGERRDGCANSRAGS